MWTLFYELQENAQNFLMWPPFESAYQIGFNMFCKKSSLYYPPIRVYQIPFQNQNIFLKHFRTFVDRNGFDIFDETNHLLNIIEGLFYKACFPV